MGESLNSTATDTLTYVLHGLRVLRTMLDAAGLHTAKADEMIAAVEEELKCQHDWFMFNPRLCCCRKCGIVRRHDGKNKPCKGPAPVTIRVLGDDHG